MVAFWIGWKKGWILLYHNVQIMAYSLRIIDSASIAMVSLAAIRYGATTNPVSWQTTVIYCSGVAFFFAIISERLRIYRGWRTEEVWRELLTLWETLIYSTGLACLATEIYGTGLSGLVYLAALVASLFVLVATRVAMRATIRRLRRRGDDYRVWLIVGHNDRSAALAKTILANPHFGIRIDDIVDLADQNEGPSTHRHEFETMPLSSIANERLRTTEAIRDIVRTRVIDEVVITLPVRSHYDRIREIVDICSEAGLSVKLKPDVLEMPGFFTEFSSVGGIPLVTHYSGPSSYLSLVLKRLVDFVGAAAGLVFLTPIFLCLAMAVKLTSRGPILFFQTRVGMHGRRFRIIKFRTMVKEAPKIRAQIAEMNERDGTAFKMRNDPRVTSSGRWMRKYHLDELPQLWNVLVGDMSIVGPRPLPVQEAFGNEWWQRRRLTMPPGLTCYWQLADDPSMPFRQWMELDMAYIDRWSLWLDFKLIALTFATVARGRGW